MNMSHATRVKMKIWAFVLSVSASVIFTTAAFAQGASDMITGQAKEVGSWQATTILAAIALMSISAVVIMARFIVQRDREDRELMTKTLAELHTAVRESTEASRWCMKNGGKGGS